MSLFDPKDIDRKREELMRQVDQIHGDGFGRIHNATVTKPNLLTDEEQTRHLRKRDEVSIPKPVA